jgi:hypothetical protein
MVKSHFACQNYTSSYQNHTYESVLKDLRVNVRINLKNNTQNCEFNTLTYPFHIFAFRFSSVDMQPILVCRAD